MEILELIKYFKSPGRPVGTFSEKFDGELGTDKHKAFILKRTLLKNPLSIGDTGYYKGLYGIVEDIIDDAEVCQWDGLSAQPIVFFLHDKGMVIHCHPNAIKRRKKGKK